MKSIKDIANKANVSPGTVDRVIHNRGGVSEKTKQRILKIIKDYDFKINPIASSLALKKRYKIATLIPKLVDSNGFWEAPKNGIEKAAEDIKNYGVTIQNHGFDQFDVNTFITAFNDVIKSTPDAVLIAPVFKKQTQKLVLQLEKINIPYIFINIEIEGLKNLSFIGQSSFKGGYLAAKMTDLLLKKKLAVSIIKIRKNSINYHGIEQRILGFKSYFKDVGSPIHIKAITIDSINDPNSVDRTLTKHLADNPSTEAFFIPSSKTSKIAKHLSESNIKGIHLIGFDTTSENILYLKKDVINILISQKPFQQGYQGIKILFEYIVLKKTPKPFHYSPIEIVVKENIDFLNTDLS